MPALGAPDVPSPKLFLTWIGAGIVFLAMFIGAAAWNRRCAARVRSANQDIDSRNDRWRELKEKLNYWPAAKEKMDALDKEVEAITRQRDDDKRSESIASVACVVCLLGFTGSFRIGTNVRRTQLGR